MRSSKGGCVENSLEVALESSGDSIQICATDVERCRTTVLSLCNTSRARLRPAGLRVNSTAVTSASASRFREIARRSSNAAIGARIKTTIEAMSAMGFWLLSLLSLRPPPPKIIIRIRKSLRMAIAPAVVAATAETNVSRLATWASS